LEPLVTDVSVALAAAATVPDACRAVLDSIGRHGRVTGSVLLPVHDHLRTIAACGSWQAYAAVAPGSGVIGRVYATAQTVVMANVASDGRSPAPQIEVCVPVTGVTGPIGVLCLEWKTPIDTDEWRSAAERIGVMLGARIVELGGPPRESRSEKLLRHALALTTAASEEELLARSLRAARDVSGLATQLILLDQPEEFEIHVDQARPTALGARMAALDVETLRGFISRAARYGSSYSLGDPDELDSDGDEVLTELGVRTLVTVPVGVRPESDTVVGVLLCADDVITRPDAQLVTQMELLTAQAWSSLERLHTLASLRERATSDPLTGLQHQGSFGERLSQSRPGHTAVFTIDIDGFKSINDTYGHQAGDRALVNLARALTSELRSEDELYRIGGDEFAAVVDVQRAEEALGVADRLVAAARSVGQTISIGVAIQREGESAEETLSRADTAMYVAKRAGRDGVRLAA
jgi:diguanylate cyclase (GGDEF)-like protein